MAVCWVILKGQQIYTVKRVVHSLLYTVAKCNFFSVVTWNDIIKYLHKCEGCTQFCEILYIFTIWISINIGSNKLKGLVHDVCQRNADNFKQSFILSVCLQDKGDTSIIVDHRSVPAVLLVDMIHRNPTFVTDISKPLFSLSTEWLVTGVTSQDSKPTWCVSMFVRHWLAVLMLDSVSSNPRFWHFTEIFIYVPHKSCYLAENFYFNSLLWDGINMLNMKDWNMLLFIIIFM